MEDLKERFDQGVGSMKKGFKTEKEKMELNKEIKELESKLQSLYNIRGKEVLKLGEGFYKKVRLGEIENYDNEIISNLREVDREIFNMLQLIDRKIGASKANSCNQCGANLEPNDKFCKKCGAAVVLKEENKDDMKECSICNIKNQEDNNFSISCGNKFEG